MELVQTVKGKPKLIYRGYMYTRQIRKPTTIRWRCVDRNGGCKGTLTTDLRTQFPVPRQPHCHAPDMTAVEVTKCRAVIAERATNSSDSPNTIYTEEVTKLSFPAKAAMLSSETIRRGIARLRARMMPVEPTSLAELVIQAPWTELGDGQKFLFYDDADGDDGRILAFATDANLRRLSRASRWYMDGTYAVAPQLFLQLYVIHVAVGERTCPVLYAMLEKKTEAAYARLFGAIVDRCHAVGCHPAPGVIMIDFELPVSCAIVNVFGGRTRVQHCFFHLTQSVWRKVKDQGLTANFRNDAGFSHFCGMVCALAFLPPDRVAEGVRHLRGVLPDGDDGAAAILDYFDSTYVSGRFVRGQERAEPGIRVRRLPARFPAARWSVHDATLNGGPRTNNVCEAWNSKYAHLVAGQNHLSVWRSIQMLRKEQGATDTLVAQAETGQPPRRRQKRQTVRLQTRLYNLCGEFVNNQKTVGEFLSAVGHTVHL